MQPSIFLRTGPQSGMRFILAGPRVTLGRGPANQIQLTDREVSRRHLEFISDGGEMWLRDAGSENGTFLNGQAVHWAQLQTGDVVRIGQTEMLFTGGGLSGQLGGPPVSVQLLPQGPAGNKTATDEPLVPELDKPAFYSADGSGSGSQLLKRSDLEFVYSAFQTIGLESDFQALAKKILKLIFDWVGVDRGCVLLLDPALDDFVVTAAQVREPSEDSQIRVSRSILRYVRREQVGILTEDARDDARWGDTDSTIEAGVHEAICVPLQGRDKLLGVLYVDTFLKPFRKTEPSDRVLTADHLQIMLAVGSLAGLAVENAIYHQELLAKERLSAIGETIATLSHHIKNILQGLKSGTYLLEEGLKHETQEETKRGWQIVKRYQEAIAKLVVDMLSYSREREPQRLPGNLNQTVADCVELNRSQAVDAGVQLEWCPMDGSPVLDYDPFGLSHAVNNLVQNAIEACEGRNQAKVTVAVGWGRDRAAYRIVVQDNGAGISAEHLEQIFRLFHSTKGSRGTGLGLAVSQKIVEEHGGQLTVESHLGSGSKFTIELPDSNAGDVASITSEQLKPNFKGMANNRLESEAADPL